MIIASHLATITAMLYAIQIYLCCFACYSYTVCCLLLAFCLYLLYCRGAAYPAPPTLSPTFFGWIADLLRIPDSDIPKLSGPDAWVHVRLMYIMAILFIYSTIFAIGVLLPINYSGGNDLSEFDQLSVANITVGNQRYWAHLVYCYGFSFLAFYLLKQAWEQLLNIRMEWLKKQFLTNPLAVSSVLLHNLPPNITSESALRDRLELMFPDKVAGVWMGRDTKGLDEIILKRNDALANLEKLLLLHERALADPKAKPKAKARPMVATKFCCLKKMDAIEYWHGELNKWNGKIKEFQTKYAAGEIPLLKSAFLTLLTPSAAHAAGKMIYTTVPFEFTAKPAPEPRDIFWPNLTMNRHQRIVRSILIGLAVIGLIFVWSIPVAFVQSLANLRGLSSEVPFLGTIIDFLPSDFVSFIEGFLPPLVLVVFMILVPIILMAFSKIKGIEAHRYFHHI